MSFITSIKQPLWFIGFVLLLSACGGGSGGGDGDAIEEDTDVTGSISLPDEVDTEGEYPATVQAFYSDACTETPPAAVFSDENGDYSITVNCGSAGQVFLVYVSRTGDYGYSVEVEPESDSAGEEISSPVTLQLMEEMPVTVTIASGFDGAFDTADIRTGLSDDGLGSVLIDDIETFDGEQVFTDHQQTVVASADLLMSKIPVGHGMRLIGDLQGSYLDGAETVNGSIERVTDYVTITTELEESAELTFDSVTDLISRTVRFTTEGEYDPTTPVPQTFGSTSRLYNLASIPYRQDIFHLTVTFMDNLEVSIEGESLSSGVEWEYDLNVDSLEDVVLDIVNTATDEESTFTYEFYSEGFDTSTDLQMYYRVDSDITGVSTTISNPRNFEPSDIDKTHDIYVDHTVDEIALTFTLDSELQAFSFDGEVYPANASNVISIDPSVEDGENLFPVVVTSEDTAVSTEYEVRIVRSLADNANLRSLSAAFVPSEGAGFTELVTGFDEETTTYFANTENDGVRIVANAYPGTTLRLFNNGEEITTDFTQLVQGVSLIEGLNEIEIEVTAADDVTVRTYTIEITRDPDCPPFSELPECIVPL